MHACLSLCGWVVLLGVVQLLHQSVTQADVSITLRDQWPTLCHSLLDRSLGSLPSQIETARANLCRNGNPKCACSCDDECRRRHSRLQNCCRAKGVKSECQAMCRYDVDEVEFRCKAKQCSQVTQVWTYCAADTQDTSKNVQCCRDHGIPESCMRFCEGDVPSRRDFGIEHMQCVFSYTTIFGCFARNLPDTISWDKDGRVFPPQTEPFHPWQSRLIENSTPKNCQY